MMAVISAATWVCSCSARLRSATLNRLIRRNRTKPTKAGSQKLSPRKVTVTTVATAGHGILSKEGNEDRTPVGFYETWICAGCGYTEWYAKDPENLLERLSKIRDSGVSVLSAPPAAPYR